MTPAHARFQTAIHATVLIAALATTGCTGLPAAYNPSSSKTYQSESYQPMGKKLGAPGEVGHAGRDFCRHLSGAARGHALSQMRAGWGFGVAGLTAIGAGAVLTGVGGSDSEPRRVVNMSVPLVGSVLVVTAVAFFLREREASKLASITAKAAALDDKNDELAGTTCADSLADWESSRSTASDALLTKLKEKADKASDSAADAKKTQAKNDQLEKDKAKLEAEKAQLDEDKKKLEEESKALKAAWPTKLTPLPPGISP